MEIKVNNRFVLATLGEPTMYLVSQHWGKYCFNDNIQVATKFPNRELAEEMIEYYRQDTGDMRDLVILPLKITYELINEIKE